jgi:predicted SnoaL-like aldol condensation-catalyzing enzyme
MKHHNVYFAGDAKSLEQAMIENHERFPHKTMEVKHAVEEGVIVIVHSHVLLKPGDAGVALVHIFRFEGEKIAEMWDLGQQVPDVSPNEHGMF